MSRPRKPTNVIELTGGFKKDPQRKRGNEPKPAGTLKSAPKHLDADAKKCWKEIVSVMPAGVLTKADGMIVEIAAVLMVKFRKDLSAMTASKMNLLINCLTRIGMTPADRSKINIGSPEDEKNPFENI